MIPKKYSAADGFKWQVFNKIFGDQEGSQVVPIRACTTFMLRKYYMLRLLVYATWSREQLCFGI